MSEVSQPTNEARNEQLRWLLYREFLLEPELYAEAGLHDLPRQLAARVGCAAAEALERVAQCSAPEPISLGELTQWLTIRDMQLTSRTAAAVAEELKQPTASYDQCIRMALCYAVAGMHAHVYSALRAAGAKRDDWARHHFVYGLMNGLSGDAERALWELEMALQREPYEDGRARIRQAIAILQRDAKAAE
jgi:hypothetical protein